MKSTLLLLALPVLAGCQFPSTNRLVPARALNEPKRLERGTVTRIRDVVIEGTPRGYGARGSLLGAAAGTGVKGGFTPKAVGAAGGMIVGQLIGDAVEDYAQRRAGQEIGVALTNGTTLLVTQVAPPQFNVGDEVLVLYSRNGQVEVVAP